MLSLSIMEQRQIIGGKKTPALKIWSKDGKTSYYALYDSKLDALKELAFCFIDGRKAEYVELDL